MKTIPRVERLTGRVKAPPSKSYTARALLLASMTEGETTIENPLDSDDSRFMLEALKKIGFVTSGSFQQGITIGPRLSMSANEVELYVGNAGTAMRFLTGYLSFTPGRYLLQGESRMHERPIGDLVDALLAIGAEIEYVDKIGYPPLRIRGKKIRGGFEVPVSGQTSSQFVSSLMLAAPSIPGGLTVRATNLVSRPYVAITREILEAFGAEVTQEGDATRVRSTTLQKPFYRVQGDYSSASYWFAAAAATGGEITVEDLDPASPQGDRGLLGVLEQMGCAVSWNETAATVRGPRTLRGGSFDFNAMPDLVPTVAAIAPFADTPVEITNVANLRVKESDRLAVIASSLRQLGTAAQEGPDFLSVQPGIGSAETTIDSVNDHRIAMSFAITGLRRGGVSITGENAVSKSYPRFWKTLDELVQKSVSA